jgi:redox-sensing transcriptional repressor
MMAGYVSDAVIRRLPGYYRHLKELEKEGVHQISSQELGGRMHLTASQIRQDINCFGGFGRQGFGYSVAELREHIGSILGIDREQTMLIVGAGNIGRAVALSDSFPLSGFRVAAIFDKDPEKVGLKIGAITVQDIAHIARYIAENRIDICVLAVPVEKAQAVAEELYQIGLRAFWNFAPMDIKLPQDSVLMNVHLEEGLQVLSYRMLHRDE